MRTLIVAATALEVAALAPHFDLPQERAVLRRGRYRQQPVDLLVTGVGMVATAVWCAKTLAAEHYDLALNLGVCGSFDSALPPGTVVRVVSDRMSELGAEDGERFLALQQMQLLQADEFPYVDGALLASDSIDNPVLASLPRAHGITVNTVHGAEQSIAQVQARCAPQVESMEGAAFIFASLVAGVPCAQIRAVSNVVERRNREAWKMPLAIDNLTRTAVAILDAA